MGDMVLTPEESQIVKRDDESWLVDGSTPTIDLAWALGIDIPTVDKPYETAAGFIMYQLRKIPKRTDFISAATALRFWTSTATASTRFS